MKKPDEIWLHWNIASICNLSCNYCFTSNKSGSASCVNIENFSTFFRNNEEYKFIVSLTGNGEPFLSIDNIVELSRLITHKNRLGLITNLTRSDVIKVFVNTITPDKTAFIVTSFHFLELKKRGLIKTFINNLKLLLSFGYVPSLEIVSDPALSISQDSYNDLLNYLSVINEIGIVPVFVPCIMKNKIFSPYSFDSEIQKDLLKNAKFRDFDENKYSMFKGCLCNAGYNAFVVYNQGNIHPCFQKKKNIGNIFNPHFKFDDYFNNLKKDDLICRSKICNCPMPLYDYGLFQSFLKRI
ncbi:MAG: radical SAM protein [Candidatus Delongbacteria bacterium]|nr:radical SAM protein [Candidatus Delongbacteria bacterium]MBN2834468.1 radical SAM protein [Candidatus Delongbacteria bacterium]